MGRERAVLPEDSVGAAKRIHPSWASMVLVRRRFRWRRSLAEPSLLATVSLPKKRNGTRERAFQTDLMKGKIPSHPKVSRRPML